MLYTQTEVWTLFYVFNLAPEFFSQKLFSVGKEFEAFQSKFGKELPGTIKDLR